MLGHDCKRNGSYFGSRDAFVYALEAKTGSLNWKYSAGGSWVIATPAVLDGRVYFTTSDSLKFEALDTPKPEPCFIRCQPIFIPFSSPALAGGHAFFGTFDGKLHDVGSDRERS